MSSRGARVARGSVAASVSTLVAAVSHSTAGGLFPAPGFLALVFAFTALTCIALTGRAMSRARISLSVLISQSAFHLVFSLPSGSGASWNAGGGHHHPLLAGTSATADPMGMHLTAGMMLAHLVAAAVTAAALVHGERSILGMVESARLALSVLVGRMPVALPFARVALPPVTRFTAAPISPVTLSPASRRGPPADIPLPI